jgi:hypothetical protein
MIVIYPESGKSVSAEVDGALTPIAGLTVPGVAGAKKTLVNGSERAGG